MNSKDVRRISYMLALTAGLSGLPGNAAPAAKNDAKTDVIVINSQAPTAPLTQQQLEARKQYNATLPAIKQHDWAQTIKLLEPVVQLDPQFSPARSALALAYARSGQYDRGIELFTKLVEDKTNPGLRYDLMNLGTSYQSKGDLANAIATFKRVQSQFPNTTEAKTAAIIQQALEPEYNRQSNLIANNNNNNEDYFDFATSGRIAKWPQTKFPLKVFIPSDSEAQKVPHYKPIFRSALEESLLEWQDKSNKTVSFVPTSDRTRADIEVIWTDDPTSLNSRAEGGEARTMLAVEGLRHVVIKILTVNEQMRKFDVGREDMKETCLHELGHALGIAGHSPNLDDIMFHTLRGTSRLTDRDVKTLEHLYRDDVAINACTDIETSTDTMSLAIRAQQLSAENKLADATKIYERVLKLDPTSEYAKVGLYSCLNNEAVAEIRAGENDKAAAKLAEAVKFVLASKMAPQSNKIAVLANYRLALRALNKPKETAEVEKQLRTSLGVEKFYETPIMLRMATGPK